MTQQYGFGNAPNRGPYGYYQQDTGGGSFAAANYQAAGQGPNVQGGSGSGAIGQQMANLGQQVNPWLGQTTNGAADVGRNAYAGQNPYLQGAIDATAQDATRAWQNGTNPQFDAAARASGSFGNTAVEQMRAQGMSDFGRNLGNTIGNMRMQDYTQQQQLDEARLNRQQQNNQFNANLSQQDLARNLAGGFQQSQLGLQGLQGQLGQQQFDARLGFDASNANAQLQQQLNMFNANQRNSLNQFNTAQANNSLLNQAQLHQNQNQFDANLANNRDQFNQGMDFRTWDANNQNMRNGQLDQLNFLNTLMGWNQNGLNNANAQQQQPLQQWLQLIQGGTGLGGLGGQNNQNLQGNPWLSGLGGILTGINAYNQLTRP